MMKENLAIAKDVAQRLLQIKAIQLNTENPFVWSSGIESPIYCDNRMVLSHVPVRNAIIDYFKESSSAFEPFDGVAGVATAGIPHGMLLADRLDLPFIYVRSKAKGHGKKNQIEGKLEANHSYLVIEDLISTGGSSLKAVEAIREAGASVRGVMAIFSYGFPRATKAFEAANCPFSTLSNFETLIQEAVAQNYIKEKDIHTLLDWKKQFQ